MADDNPRELYVRALKNTHALETQALSIMERQVERLEQYPEMEQGLRRLIAETQGQRDRLEELLTGVARLAVRAIPGADVAGLTLLEEGRADTIVATAAFVTAVDDIQYGLGEGPCISAAAENVTVVSGSLGADERWRPFGSQVARLGVHSVVSLPLATAEGVVGAMNVYARGEHRFDAHAVEGGVDLWRGPATS